MADVRVAILRKSGKKKCMEQEEKEFVKEMLEHTVGYKKNRKEKNTIS